MNSLAVLDADLCPTCGEATADMEIHEPALFIGCDYGATRSTVRRYCRQPLCGWWMERSVGASSPRR